MLNRFFLHVFFFVAAISPAFGGMEFIGATQLGYAPNARKQFSSSETFSSFEIRRFSDNAIVFSGAGPVKTISHDVIGGATVWVGDFSSFTVPGRYEIIAGSKASYPFDIRSDIYDQAVRASQRFFYYQRAFTAIEQPYAEGPWVHPSDISKAPANVVKGWHDAGDLTVYNATMTQAIFWLLETWSDFHPTEDNTNIPESGNSIPDLLDETRWGLEWILSMQDATGGFWACATAGGAGYYPYGLTFPHTVAPYSKTVPPTTQVTAKAVAVLGYAAGVYRPFDASFSNACLNAARRGWDWMIANPQQINDGSPSGGATMFNMYPQGNNQPLLKSNKMWAAAGMLFATGEPHYEAAFQEYYMIPDWISSFSKSETFAASLYLRVPAGANQTTKNTIRQQFYVMADGVRSDADQHPFQTGIYYWWGSTSNALHRSGEFSWRAYLLDSTRTADRDQGLSNVEYIFGRNFRNQCYVSGIDGVTKQRGGGFHHWMKALNATPWHFPGALSGGPNQAPDWADYSYPNVLPLPVWGYWGDPLNPRGGNEPIDGRFTDNDSWSTNEIVVSWNAVLVYNLYAARMVSRRNSTPSSVQDESEPNAFALSSNYPNPFNPSTTIRFTVPATAHVTLSVYNILGQKVRTLVDGVTEQGTWPVQWDGKDENGKLLASGTYLYKMQAGNFISTKKMILMK